MYTPDQSRKLGAEEGKAMENTPTYVSDLATLANVHTNHLLDVLKRRGFEINWEPRTVEADVPYVTKADVRKLMGLE